MRQPLLVLCVLGLFSCEDFAVVSTIPTTDETGVALDANVSATTNHAVDPATLDMTSFRLELGGSAISCARGADGAGTTLTLIPNELLVPGTRYTATLSTAL